MKRKIQTAVLALGVLLFSGAAATAQKTTTTTKKTNQPEMKTYIIEREVPGAGKLTEVQLKGISQTSCGVLKEMGTTIQWVHSYVAGDKIYCIYKAENAELIREHAKRGGFPANSVTEVANIISPATAEN